MNQIPTEAQEQTTLFQWAAMMSGKWPQLRLCHAIPNGGSRNPIEARHLKEQGVKAGIPDLFLPCARGGFHGLYIEMKRRKGGRVSIEQKKAIIALMEQGQFWTAPGGHRRPLKQRRLFLRLRGVGGQRVMLV